MTENTQLFDRKLLAENRRRALRLAVPGADFLMRAVASDLSDRLAAILRDFDVAVDLGTFGEHVGDALSQNNRIKSVFRASGLIAPHTAAAPSLVGDEEAIPFGDNTLDLVVSALALQFVNDLPGTFAQIRRALRPDGLFIAAFLGGDTLFELRSALMDAEIELLGGASPRVLPAVSVRDAGALLQRAGFALPVTDRDVLTVRYDTIFDLMRDLRAMGATNCLVDRRSAPTPRTVFLRAGELYAERYADPDGRIRATFEVISMSGWAPHESQQQPLKPGSAKMRLADAIGDKTSTGVK